MKLNNYSEKFQFILFSLSPLVVTLCITYLFYLFLIPQVFLLLLVFFLVYLLIIIAFISNPYIFQKISTLIHYFPSLNFKLFGERHNTFKQEYDQKNFILENISEGICAVNFQGDVVFTNQKFFKKFIKPWKLSSDIIPTIDIIFNNHEDLKQAFYRVIRLQTNESIRQIQHLHKGRELYFDITISGIEKDMKNFASVVGVFHDVTEKRLTDLMRANFVANISHEIRTPLTSILGFTEVLENKIENLEQIPVSNIRPFLKPIIQNSKKLQRLFSDLMTLSLIESERKITKSHIALDELIDQQAYLLFVNYPHKKVKLIKNITQNEIYVDQELFQQVVTNILDNSLKYSPHENLQIDISSELSSNKKEVLINISDDNHPLPTAELERIFERFYRLDSARNIHQGSGIGLSIVKQIMAKHKGRSFAENINDKTYFCLILPVN